MYNRWTNEAAKVLARVMRKAITAGIVEERVGPGDGPLRLTVGRRPISRRRGYEK
jgi:hypothetical protein